MFVLSPLVSSGTSFSRKKALRGDIKQQNGSYLKSIFVFFIFRFEIDT
jgi:hypothetical protein